MCVCVCDTRKVNIANSAYTYTHTQLIEEIIYRKKYISYSIIIILKIIFYNEDVKILEYLFAKKVWKKAKCMARGGKSWLWAF